MSNYSNLIINPLNEENSIRIINQLIQIFIRANKNNKNILENSFIQHLLFDKYFKNGSGNTITNVLVVFGYLLEKYNKIYVSKTEEKSIFNKLQTLISQSLIFYNEKNVNGLVSFSNIDEIFIPFGWINQNLDFENHAISIYIKKKGNDSKWSVYIINSGDGINYHHYYTGNNLKLNIEREEDLLSNVIIEYEIDDINKIKKIIHLSKSVSLFEIKKYYEDFIEIKRITKVYENFTDDINENNRLLDTEIEMINTKMSTENSKSQEYEKLKAQKNILEKFKNNLYRRLIKNDLLFDFEKESIRDYFYPILLNILGVQIPNNIYRLPRQYSGSCTFHSILYFIELFMFLNIQLPNKNINNLEIFNKFYEFIVEITIKSIVLYIKEKNKDTLFEKFNPETFVQYKTSISYLLKDYQKYEEILYKIYVYMNSIEEYKTIKSEFKPKIYSDYKNKLKSIDDMINLLKNEFIDNKKFNLTIYQEIVTKESELKYMIEKNKNLSNTILSYINTKMNIIMCDIIKIIINGNIDFEIYFIDKSSRQNINLNTTNFNYNQILYNYTYSKNMLRSVLSFYLFLIIMIYFKKKNFATPIIGKRKKENTKLFFYNFLRNNIISESCEKLILYYQISFNEIINIIMDNLSLYKNIQNNSKTINVFSLIDCAGARQDITIYVDFTNNYINDIINLVNCINNNDLEKYINTNKLSFFNQITINDREDTLELICNISRSIFELNASNILKNFDDENIFDYLFNSNYKDKSRTIILTFMEKIEPYKILINEFSKLNFDKIIENIELLYKIFNCNFLYIYMFITLFLTQEQKKVLNEIVKSKINKKYITSFLNNQYNDYFENFYEEFKHGIENCGGKENITEQLYLNVFNNINQSENKNNILESYLLSIMSNKDTKEIIGYEILSKVNNIYNIYKSLLSLYNNNVFYIKIGNNHNNLYIFNDNEQELKFKRRDNFLYYSYDTDYKLVNDQNNVLNNYSLNTRIKLKDIKLMKQLFYNKINFLIYFNKSNMNLIIQLYDIPSIVIIIYIRMIIKCLY